MDIEIRQRQVEGAEAQPLLAWDTVWDIDTNEADWKIGANEPQNKGGLSALHMLHTAIIHCLFTWKRVEKYELTKYDGNDTKGWWGDVIDIEDGEAELGSKLWLLYRSVLNDDVGRKAVVYAHEALQPIIKQGAVVRFDIDYTTLISQGLLGLTVNGFGADGAKIYSQRFTRVWRQEFA